MTAEQLRGVGNASSLHASGPRARAGSSRSPARRSPRRSAPARPRWSSPPAAPRPTTSRSRASSGPAAPPTRAASGCSSARSSTTPCWTRVDWLAEHEGAEVELAAGRPAAAASQPDDAARRDRGATRRRSRWSSVMWANNEVGTVQPVAELAAVAHEHGIPVHTDAVQAVGQLPVDFAACGVDALTADRPQARRPARRRRAARPARRHAACRCCTAAARSATSAPAPSTPPAIRRLRGGRRGRASSAERRGAARLGGAARRAGRRALALVPDVTVNGDWHDGRRPAPAARQRAPSPSPAARATRCCCCSTPRRRVLHRLGLPAGVPQPSHVLLAMGVPERARPAARCASSLGHTSTEADVDAFLGRAAGGRRAGPPRRRRPARRWGRGPDARPRRDVRRGRLRGRRRARCSTPATSRRGAPGAVAQRAATLRDRRPRLLHDRGRRRRPPRRRRARHPVLRLGPGRPLPATTWSRTSSPSTPPGRTPNPCLRCNEKIKFAALLDRARRARLRRRRHRPLRPVVERRTAGASCTGPSTRPRTSPTCSACSTQDQLRPVVVPARRHHQAAGPRGGRASAASPSPTSPTATTSASSPTATPAACCASRLGEQRRRHRRRRDGDGRSASTTAPTAFTVGQRKGLRPRPARPRTASRATSSQSQPGPTRSSSARPTCSASTPSPATTPAGAGRGPTGVLRVGAQVRAHGEEVPATAWADGDRVEVRLERRIRGVAPGQSVVLYDGTRVVGSATISAASVHR